MASFGQLTLIVLAGLCGPLLSASRRVLIPVVVGELLAGVVLGRSGTGWIHADNPSIQFVANIGFAVLMFVAGMHVPLRDRGLIGSLGRGAIAVVLSIVLAIACGAVIGSALGLGHAAVWAVLLATGSAALVLPELEEAGLTNPPALLAMAWATIADLVTIVAVPSVLQPSHALRAGLGAVAVTAAGGVVLAVSTRARRDKRVDRLREQSAKRSWALDLRVALLALFALCTLAEWAGTSIMIAGFVSGLVVAWEGGPQRLSEQVSGVANGLFVPVFYVVFGAGLNVRALIDSSTALALLAALVAGMLVVHLIAARLVRAPLSTGLIVVAQLGVPTAVVKLGTAEGVLTAAQGAAVIVAALISLGISTIGVALARRDAEREAD
jgi:Kef-type K+ transport system membrane component KefB